MLVQTLASKDLVQWVSAQFQSFHGRFTTSSVVFYRV